MKFLLPFAFLAALAEGQQAQQRHPHNNWNSWNYWSNGSNNNNGHFPQVTRPPRQGRGTIRITNRAPAGGTCVTPPWVGIHDGRFDIYDRFRPASMALERLAEDGNNDPLSDVFSASPGAVYDNTVGMAPICPGESAELEFVIDLVPNTVHYFSYTSMVLPSNDAFVANANPRSHVVFDRLGNLRPVRFSVFGSQALDAGTEVNDELPSTTAFFGQETPNTGTPQLDVIRPHPGFNRRGSGGILDSPDFVNAQFRRMGYRFMDIEVFASGGGNGFGSGNSVFGSGNTASSSGGSTTPIYWSYPNPGW